MEHPQTNGQAEGASKVILRELKKRLGDAKGNWADELLEVLWAYRCTPQSTTQETPYSVTYGVNAMIPIEIGDSSLRRQFFDVNLNNESMLTNLDLLHELRDRSCIREAASKVRSQCRYNSKVKHRSFHQGDLVWRIASNGRKHAGKFSPNWEGPFCIREVIGKGAYRLEYLYGTPIPATWNSSHLKFYYS